VPDFLITWQPYFLRFLFIGGAALLWLLLILCWLAFGSGPRRRRIYRRSRTLLAQGNWEEALALLRPLKSWRHSKGWQQRLRVAEAECLHAAVQDALEQKKFEAALEHAERAASTLGENPDRARQSIVDAMLAEVRRLLATTAAGSSTAPIHDMIGRTLLVQERTQEAFFWQGILHLRDGKQDRAADALEVARTGVGGIAWTFDSFTPIKASPEGEGGLRGQSSGMIDPPLYLGALLLRQGKAKESLRFLTEANRIDPGCPLVASQLGCAMIAAEGDTQLAVRALQRALGTRGFAQWTATPQRAWIDGLPEGRSYVRRLASEYPYVCPLWGSDLRILLYQANCALAQGYFRLGNFAEASQVFGKLLQESAPSLIVLRGLGLSLARLGQYDEAFKHLRTAHELAGENDRIVAGHLALCGARGKPKQDEDRRRNIAWAIRTVGRFTAPKDAEWASLISDLFAEARSIVLDLSADDQIYLCEHLLSVQATDPQAAEAYHCLQATHPQRMHREYAWLYCRAAQLHGLSHEKELEVFALAFSDVAAAQQFYGQQKWDLSAVEFAYLERAAAREPGRFPAALGPDYEPRGEQLLHARSAAAADSDALLAVAQIHCKLAPHSHAARDRLAQLHYRRGDIEAAIALLDAWHTLSPDDAVPLSRLAVIQSERGEVDRALSNIYKALDVAEGQQRGGIAFLGAQLSLRHCLLNGKEIEDAPLTEIMLAALQTAADLLQRCLHDIPDHTHALWLLAAIRWLRGAKAELVQQAQIMDRADVRDPRFHLLAAVCFAAADDHAKTLRACERANSLAEQDERHMALAVEAVFIAGWAHLLRGDEASALAAFDRVARTDDSPSRGHAQALLGNLSFQRDYLDHAIGWWKELDSDKRILWNLVQPLAGTVFLTALQAMHEGRFQDAADRIREAGKLGWRDRRLGQMLTLALASAGQKLLYS